MAPSPDDARRSRLPAARPDAGLRRLRRRTISRSPARFPRRRWPSPAVPGSIALAAARRGHRRRPRATPRAGRSASATAIAPRSWSRSTPSSGAGCRSRRGRSASWRRAAPAGPDARWSSSRIRPRRRALYARRPRPQRQRSRLAPRRARSRDAAGGLRPGRHRQLHRRHRRDGARHPGPVGGRAQQPDAVRGRRRHRRRLRTPGELRAGPGAAAAGTRPRGPTWSRAGLALRRVRRHAGRRRRRRPGRGGASRPALADAGRVRRRLPSSG